MDVELIIRGRKITTEDIAIVKIFIKKYWERGRKCISQEICEYWNWRRSQGSLKERACRDVLLQLEKKGYVKLPPSKNNNFRMRQQKLPLRPSVAKLDGRLKDLGKAELRLVETKGARELWEALVSHYHYQGYRLIVGSGLKYLAYLKGGVIACLGWGSAAWNTACRDKYIGWGKETKDKNLHHIVNNIRFLILPNVKIKYLASHLLSLGVKQLSRDWQNKYGYPIYLLETFVEKNRFKGTSYKAANWIQVGETKGYSKRGSSHFRHRNIKDVYVYPLCQDFREKLKGANN